MNSLVLDTSVIAKWYRREEDEPDAALARGILQSYVMGMVSLSVPPLAVFELGNTLLMAEGIPPEVRTAYLEDFFRLGLEIADFDETLATEALSIAATDELTYYDAAFVALARSTDSEFITADRKLARKTSYPKCRLLSDIALP